MAEEGSSEGGSTDSGTGALGNDKGGTGSSGGLGNSGGSSNNGDWRDHITDEGMRLDPTIANIKATTSEEAINALSDQLINAQKLLGGDKILRPKEDWEADKMADWRHDVLKIPKTIEEYKLEAFKKPETAHFSDEDRSSFVKSMHEAHLDDSQAAHVLQYFYDMASTSEVAEGQFLETNSQEQLNEIREMWGDEFDAKMQIAEHGLNTVAPKEFVDFIAEDPTLSTNSMIIQTFYKVGQMLMSDNPAGMGDKGGTGPVGAKGQALNQISELESSKEYLELLNPNKFLQPDEKMLKDKLLERRSELYEIAYAEDS